MAEEENRPLLELINSKDFDIPQCLKYLRIHTKTIGIHHFLISKLSTYSYEEIEFYIPQFIQLLVSFETNSMALEDFLLDFSSLFPHFSLIVFWNLQAYVFELRNDPESYSFQTVRRFINQLQNIMFNSDLPVKNPHEFRENLHPGLVTIGSIAASFALPNSTYYTLPVIKSQSKQQKAFVFHLANFQKALTKNLTLKNSRISSESIDDASLKLPQKPASISSPKVSQTFGYSSERNSMVLTGEDGIISSDDEERMSSDSIRPSNYTGSKTLNEIEEALKINTTIKSKKSTGQLSRHRSLELIQSPKPNTLSQSLPDLRESQGSPVRPYISPAESETSLNLPHYNSVNSKESILPNYSSASFHSQQRMLFANYARKETDFIMSLQNVSFRLSQIPKEARLSALRAELSMINDTILPAEIDIPQLLPLTSNRNKKYHKILKLNVNEACVLNSAERVPFLLLIEYLSDEFDFDPSSEANLRIINSQLSRSSFEKSTSVTKRDIGPYSAVNLENDEGDPSSDTTGSMVNEETDLGDLKDLNNWKSEQDLNKLKLLEGQNIRNEELRGSSPQLTDVPSKVLANQMRIASVMLQQLEDAGKENTEQSASIRNRIIQSMISLQDQFEAINYEKLNELKGDDPDAGERKMENDFKLGEDWLKKKMRIKKASVYGHLKNWDLCSVIAKNGDDLPQEAFACQLITIVSNIWKAEEVPAWTKKMRILITSANTGLVETINNAMSIHSIKKSLTEHSIAGGDNSKGRIFSLSDYFEKLFGPTSLSKYKKSQENFARSLASYSILSYIFQIKDRHNGNIMVDNEGHIIHIDFGFILSNSPGSLNFEAAPFKFTQEYVDLLGGFDSVYYALFQEVCKKCFKAVRKHSEQIIDIVELMQKDSTLPCFKNGENTSVLLKQRLQLQLSDDQVDSFVEISLISKSLGSMYTRLYDQYQMVTQGIYN
ncbi:hypothetical protein CANTEDRAFT_114597 [Yamadazyma tenuis ATCC 10573]|uniref:1-phosphatidylinositol 4-kinase n=2 Tax=Candida tenuis (strain ATCC 10573 / BCRC 21748 / CBS 615 / JCM 9827 / NBRC 10315 / NRRL Y-1498 / VKM Y-70) TaxID=590646 RepID=G3B5T6_CANTC|nr:uncharacterized protein CANTEDRAFT_114597 [Yamadazyma tenuis ATCC 10573]EGV63299.1 hypothetical protein CANTEDRAFT_114597 [Yamadazyma tenuis ATCC 10573]